MNSNNLQTKPRKRRTGIFGCLLGFLILFGAAYVLSTILPDSWDMLVAPWAHSISGQPTLTGTWTGEFTSSSGIQFALYLSIGRARLPSGRYYTPRNLGAMIDGQAAWCDNSGRHAENIPIGGSVPTFTGFNGIADKVHSTLILAGQTVAGLWPDEFDGRWTGDTLTLQPNLADWDGDNTVSTVDETAESLTMKKRTQSTYQELCKN